MVGTFRIGKVFGFEISIHWSWLLIFLLITWTFANSTLEEFYPDWTSARRWIVGSAVSIIFFLSILAHEMSHSIVARRYGIGVSSITLFVFGGVSNLTKEPENSRQEFWIAIVGPLASFLMALIFAIAWYLLKPIEEGAAGVAVHLAAINLAIGFFNLVPGFPLDGGRVLRSVFWAKKRNIVDATLLASTIGQGVAFAIMALGGVVFVLGFWLSGIWLFLIGNFLRSASVASYEQLFVEKVLKGILASAVARQDYVPVAPDMRLSQLADQEVLASHGRCFPVMAGQELLGLITLSDLRKVPCEEWPETTVFRAMTPFSQLRKAEINDDLPAVLVLMTSGDINQVPLVEGNLLVGLIHRADVIRYIQVRQEIGTGATTD